MLNGRFHEHYFCRFMVQSEQEQDDLNLCQIPFDDLSSGQMGKFLPVYNSFLGEFVFSELFPFLSDKNNFRGCSFFWSNHIYLHG